MGIATRQRLSVGRGTVVSVTEESVVGRMIVAPNPASAGVTITVPDDATTGTLSIYDLFGTRVYSTTIEGAVTHWDGRSQSGTLIPSGVYQVVLTTPRGVVQSPVQIVR